MKKLVLVFGIMISSLMIFNLIKNSLAGIELKEQSNIINKPSSTNIIKDVDVIQPTNSRYIEYAETSFEQMPDKKRVYFFHAKWCPTCKAADEEFKQNSVKIPTDVILFKTDYDREEDLKSKYGITYQHTFVFVDSRGEEIKKWNGGGIIELIRNTTQI